MSQRVITTDQHAELLRKAFDQVCDPDDWKAPIDCVVPYDTANVYMRAIEFMTGAQVFATTAGVDNGKFRLTCCGYRAGPCGDH